MLRTVPLLVALAAIPAFAMPRPHSDDEWLEVATHVVSAKVDGIAFTIQLPVDLGENNPRDATSREWRDDGDYYGQPHVTVTTYDYDFPKTLKEAESTFATSDLTVIKSELTKDRYTSVTKTKTFVTVNVLVRAGKKVLHCEAGKSHVPAMTNQDKLAPWYEKLCASMKPR